MSEESDDDDGHAVLGYGCGLVGGSGAATVLRL